MSEHSMACEYPEGCSCGASKSNDLQATVDRLRDQVRLRDLEADGVAIQFLALRRELEAVKADKERVIEALEEIIKAHRFDPVFTQPGGSLDVARAAIASAKENQGGAKTL